MMFEKRMYSDQSVFCWVRSMWDLMEKTRKAEMPVYRPSTTFLGRNEGQYHSNPDTTEPSLGVRGFLYISRHIYPFQVVFFLQPILGEARLISWVPFHRRSASILRVGYFRKSFSPDQALGLQLPQRITSNSYEMIFLPLVPVATVFPANHLLNPRSIICRNISSHNSLVVSTSRVQ